MRRSEIIGLEAGPAQTEDDCGWVDFPGKSMTVTLRGGAG
ncbi:hypothetical protein CHELA1G2_21219 [Hyphomicrobiales bacterium]|nr:hypothetical protein CHELA1G2_21219 [Hyphomicrobiales bacterium]